MAKAALEKVKVRMLVNTAYQGPRKEGDVISVPKDFANRWVKNKIAELVLGDENDEDEEIIGQEDENESEGTGEVTDTQESDGETEEEPGIEEMYDAMSAKELYELCQEKGLEVEAKKPKKYYIEKLNEAE